MPYALGQAYAPEAALDAECRYAYACYLIADAAVAYRGGHVYLALVALARADVNLAGSLVGYGVSKVPYAECLRQGACRCRQKGCQHY